MVVTGIIYDQRKKTLLVVRTSLYNIRMYKCTSINTVQHALEGRVVAALGSLQEGTHLLHFGCVELGHIKKKNIETQSQYYHRVGRLYK